MLPQTEISPMKPVLVLRHAPHEGLGTLGDALVAGQLALTQVDLFREPLATFSPRQWAGLVVMGGPMNVDETTRYPFLGDEVVWIRRAVDDGLPVLGVCLGSQLLAKTLGARVTPNRVKEIGWYEVELTSAASDDPLLAGCQKSESVFQWHGDTFNLPQGAVQLARGKSCENQAFRYGKCAYGLQFHLEVTAPMIDTWLCEDGNCGELSQLDYIDPAAIRRQTPERIGPLEQLSHLVFGRFAALCHHRSIR
jgi:GMP synthase (glutamine-hydrolysing)